MGIKDFHTHTKHYISRVHIREYRGERIGCDASAWLHRGASPFSWALWHGETPWNDRNEDPPWVAYPMKMIEMLREHGVEPVLVFDGCRNPAKAPTSHLRAERRKRAEHRARDALSSNNDEEARKAIMQTVEVTPQMAYDLIQRLHAYKVQFIVAPYEADAQLAYLSSLPWKEGGIAAVLTEDSDLIAYGCNALLFKCDVKGEGFADEMRLDRMLSVDLATIQKEKEAQQAAAAAAAAIKNGEQNNDGAEVIDLTVEPTKSKSTGGKNVSFFQWDHEMVLTTCILSGCDFLQNITGLGFKTAYSLVQIGRDLPGTFAHMRENTRWGDKLTLEYEKGAKRARESFLYALVFNPMTGNTTRLQELPDHLSRLPENELPAHIGPEMDRTLVHGIAYGYINPHTMQPFDPRIPPPVLETSRWTIQLNPPSRLLHSSNANTNNNGGSGSGGNWFTVGKAGATAAAAPLHNNGNSTVNISQFVNSPAASGGSGRGGAVNAESGRNEKNASTHHGHPSGQQNQPLEGKQQQRQQQPDSVAPIASQSTASLQNVQDLVQMYTANTTPSVATKSNQSAPSVAVASTVIAPAALVATKPHGRSRFAPASLTGKASNNPFASVARVPLQPEVRPQQQYQKQKQKPPKEMAMSPWPPQQQPAWFIGPTEGVQSQKTASLGSLFNSQSTTTTTSSYAQPQAWQRNPQQQQQQHQNKALNLEHKHVATTSLRLPSRAALGAPQSQPSVSLHGALFSNSTDARDPTQILNKSIFFSGGPQQNTNSTAGVGGVAGWNRGSDQREVTSPLKGQVRHHAQHTTTTTTKVEKPVAMASRLPLGQQPRAQNNTAYLSQQQQQQRQQTNGTNASAWNVRKPTVSSFNSLENSRSTSSGGKRKSSDGGGGKSKKSSKADKKMQAAAANCARISAFFAPKKA